VTEVRYPSPAGPYPLVVFGHGFNLVPRVYRRLLDAVASAGYVVAAPAFPLERANAPGGPDESDIVNQPRDVSFVISRMLAASAAGGPLSGLIDRRSIAVAGHSDGATTASAVGYDRRYRDPRAGAVVTLAGGFLGGSSPRGAPPLLAAQGTADQVNPPRATYSFYARARRPKYLLRLVGAGHEDPYTREQPQLGVVERTVVAFLDLYLEHRPEAARRLATAGTVRGISRLTSQP
jgi:dienelactone hydrolase